MLEIPATTDIIPPMAIINGIKPRTTTIKSDAQTKIPKQPATINKIPTKIASISHL